MSKRLIIVGAGDLGKEVLGWMQLSGFLSHFSRHCFIDDNISCLKANGYELTYLGNIDGFYPTEGDELIATIASPNSRSTVVEKLLSHGSIFSSYIDPSVLLSSSSKVGQGSIILPYSVISNDSVIGNHSIINCHSSIGHNVLIGSFVSISAHVDIMGHCEVSDNVFMGSGSRVLPTKRIGEFATIGAGATAARSVPAGKTLYAPLSKIL